MVLTNMKCNEHLEHGHGTAMERPTFRTANVQDCQGTAKFFLKNLRLLQSMKCYEYSEHGHGTAMGRPMDGQETANFFMIFLGFPRFFIEF